MHKERSGEERERLSAEIADRLDLPMTALGILFLLLVVAETAMEPAGGLSRAFQVASWLLWAAFVAEFLIRLVVAPSTSRFLLRNWWQVLFLALPFLRFLRLIRLVRLTRAGRVVSSAVRGSRTARRTLSSRLGWLLSLTLIVILAASQLLYTFAPYENYGVALHDAALATIAGEPLSSGPTGLTRVADVLLATYSVVVFAALAGTIGAYFLRGEQREGA